MATLDDLRAVRREQETGEGMPSLEKLKAARSELGPEPEPRSHAMAFLNRGIAQVLGAPVDLANAALSLVGLGSEEPVGGSRSIERGMRAVSEGIVPREGEEAETLSERIAQGAGTAFGGLPFSAAAAGVRGTSAAAQSLREIGQTVARHPFVTTGVEAISGAGAGGGEYLANELFPENELAQTVGAMIGGLGLPALPMLAFRASGGRLATRVVRSQLAGFTRRGAEAQASQRLRNLAGDDLDNVIARLRQPDTLPQAELSPAARTGNRRILALEKAVLDADQQLEGQFRARTQRSNEIIREEIRHLGGTGSVDAMRNFVAKKRDYLIGLLHQRVKEAGLIAQQKLAKLRPGTDRAVANRIVRDELENALSAALATERQIWDALPLETRVGTLNTNDALVRSVRELVKGETLADLPAELRRFVSKGPKGKLKLRLRNVEEARVLHRARSRALEDMRLARAAGRRNEARILDRFQEAILADLDALEARATGDVGESYRNALNFSRQLNEKFRRGTVGRLLGFERTGAPAVPPDLTLERSIGRGGPSGAVATDDILRAIPDASRPQARAATLDFVKTMFAEQTTTRDQFSPDAARRFLARNDALLQRFPEFRAEIEAAIKANKLSDDLAKRVNTLTRSLHDKRVSRAALFLDAPVDQEIKAILRDPNPRLATRDLIRMANRDKSGEAVKGLRAAFSEFLINSGRAGFDPDGTEIFSGKAIRKTISDPRVRAVTQELLTPDQRANLDRIVKTIERMEIAQSKDLPNIGGIITSADMPILEFFVTTLGARSGARLGHGVTGASLKTASFGSEKAKRIFLALVDKIARHGARGLLIDAIQDKDLMLALLTKTDTLKAQEFVTRRLNAWLLAQADQRTNQILEGDNSS